MAQGVADFPAVFFHILCVSIKIHILKKQEEETLAPLRNVVADGSRTIFSLSLSPNKGNTHKYTLLDVNQEDEN